MSSDTPSLRFTLGEQPGLPSIEATPSDDPAAMELLVPILPPEGVVAVKLSDVAARAATLVTGKLDVSGVRGGAAAAVVSALLRTGRRIVVVAEGAEEARRAAQDIGFLAEKGALAARPEGDEEASGDILVLTASESSPYAEVNPDRRGEMARLATLSHLALGRPWRVLVVSALALCRKTAPRDVVADRTERIVAESELDRDALVRRLSESGYLRVPVVEDPGSFAVRGALLDVWPPSSESPVRVELYGDLVLSLKPFTAEEQRTKKGEGAGGLAALLLPPVREAVLDPKAVARAKAKVAELADAIDLPTRKARALSDDVAEGRTFFGAEGLLPAYYEQLATLFDFIPDDALFVFDDPPPVTRIVRSELERANADVLGKSHDVHFPPDAFFLSEDGITEKLARFGKVALHRTPVLGEAGTGLSELETQSDPLDIAARDHEDLQRAVKTARSSKGKTAILAPLARRIAHFRDHGLRVFITARAQTQAERLTSLLRHQGVRCRARLSTFDPEWLVSPPTGEDVAEIVVGPLARGFVLPADGLVIVTEEEVFGQRAHRRREAATGTNAAKPFLEDLRSLATGDFVVHVEHGIGRYLGLFHKEVGGNTVDLLVVEYAGGDKLYLPVYRLNQIQKYSGGDGGQAKIDRLGGSTFSRTKARVEKAVRQMADELLRLYAERQAQPGEALPEAGDDYRAFEATFPFDETPDQAKAINDVNHDLETAKVMDRLVCGDVGFGKTEVAVRAAFRVAMAGKQVAVLCPTTVLAQQHFRTFEARMRDYPISVRIVSRFQSKKEQGETVVAIKEGKADIVIGTHRLLSKDIRFKNLGLLVVDEEQRFGVTHKERIKQLKATVDVLTLTATPIPRTLQMAVTGIRDLSLITTPPVDRRAVRTIVTRADDAILKEAVRRELSRGGQVFYVYNRIEGLYEKAHKLQELVPEARIAVAHGQMGRGRGASDEERAQALEETMLDFVEGRYDVLAATAIVESGLDIPRANTMIIDRADLFGLAQLYQLRGRVGRSKERAYCYLVVPPENALTDEARARIEALERHTALGSGFQIASLDLELRGAGDLLGGEQSGNVGSVGLDLFCRMLEDAVHELRGETVVHDVDPELSFDVDARIPEDYVAEVGVRLALYKRLASAIDEAHVADIAAEMEDRFGAPPDEARRFVQLMGQKTELRKIRALGCEAVPRSVTLHLREDTLLDPKKIAALVHRPKSPYKLTPDMRLVRRFDAEGDALSNVETVLSELSRCYRDAS